MIAVKRTAVGLEIVVSVLAGLALAAAYAGPLRFDVFGATLSVRTLRRPLLAAAVLLAGRLWLARGQPLVRTALGSSCRTALGALIVAGVVGWFTFLSTTVGGADSYGYVSAADRLLAGALIQTEPLSTVMPFPDGIAAASPLGYVPAARSPHASVPAYPLGLPALMAVAKIVARPAGVFFVAPLMGLLLVVCTWSIGRDWYSDAETALLACALVALNPIVFTYSIQPMSDVPAAAALATSVAALSRPLRWPVLAGLAGAGAIVIRPALGPLVMLLALVPMIVDGRTVLAETRRYLIPVIAGVVFQAWSQWYLYGHPLASGYGGIAGLFSLDTLATNARSYGYWGGLALGPVWVVASAVGFSRGGRRLRVVSTVVVAGVALPYLFYRPYDHWETLRFLLPAIHVLTLLAAGGLMWAARRAAGEGFGLVAATTIALLMIGSWVQWFEGQRVSAMPAHESRHALAGALVAHASPDRSVVLALQHSGSLRYYAGRRTINWDRIPAGELTVTVRALQATGFDVFLMIDSPEERTLFERRHGRALEDGSWLPAGQRRDVQLFRAASP